MRSHGLLVVPLLGFGMLAACGATDAGIGEEAPWNNERGCPKTMPEDGKSCAIEVTCFYGEERCCGKARPSFVCDCTNEGEFGCTASDYCNIDTIGCTAEYPCTDEECGPAPGAPSVLCDDGSTAGPVCLRSLEGECGWQITSCPDDTCDPDNNQYETAGCECVSNSECTCQVFTGSEFLPEAQQSVCDGNTNTCIPCFYL